jgi:hypothetical protein
MLLDSGRDCPCCEERQASSRAQRHAVAAAVDTAMQYASETERHTATERQLHETVTARAWAREHEWEQAAHGITSSLQKSRTLLIWQRYKPLTPAEVLTVIPQYHPLWADVPTDELLWIDDVACHGNFRQWAKITYLLQEEHGGPDMKGPDTADPPHQPTPHSAAAPLPAYSRDLVRAVLSRLDPTQRHTD